MNGNEMAKAAALDVTEGARGESLDVLKDLAAGAGYYGKRGGWIVEDATGERVAYQWARFAQMVLDNEVDLFRSAEAEAQNVSGDLPLEPAITLAYVTQTAPVEVSPGSSVMVVLEHEVRANTEGVCESGAALACEGEGFLRILPESMLPGQERTQVTQCLPCYEASAAAYVRKLHHYTRTEV